MRFVFSVDAIGCIVVVSCRELKFLLHYTKSLQRLTDYEIKLSGHNGFILNLLCSC